MADVFRALDDETRRLILDELFSRDGDDAWLTVVSPESPDGPELLLEPSSHPAVKPFRDALVEDGIPLCQFAVDDVAAEHDRLSRKGVTFTVPPTDVGPAVMGVFDDTCGILIQIISTKQAPSDE